jgi:hypothetical protein
MSELITFFLIWISFNLLLAALLYLPTVVMLRPHLIYCCSHAA